MKFKQHERVMLLENAEEGWPEERGEVIAVEEGTYADMYLVLLDPEYWQEGDSREDGIREVHADQMRPVLPHDFIIRPAG